MVSAPAAQKPQNDMLLAHALASEHVYFALGAREQSGAGWRFLAMPGLSVLPAASVSYLESEHLPESELARAIAHIETAFLISAPASRESTQRKQIPFWHRSWSVKATVAE